MSLKMGPFMVDEYKQEWKNIMERRYGAGNCPTTGPDCFEAWLSGQVYSLRGNLAFIKGQRETAEQSVRALKKQRNLALILCVIFFLMAMLFAFRPEDIQKQQTEEAGLISAPPASVVEINYVASANSDKYHLPSCEYAKNILPENRIEINSKLDLAIAENKGYTPCSACRPR